MLGDKRFLRTFKARNILSFGPESPEIELQSLNVLIGPNGAGKSNLIETIALLQAAPGNLLEPIQTGGGIGEWLWKGVDSSPTAEIDVTVSPPQGKMPLRHRLEFTMVGQRAELVDEAIEDAGPATNPDFYYRYQRGHPVLNARPAPPLAPPSFYRERRELRAPPADPRQSRVLHDEPRCADFVGGCQRAVHAVLPREREAVRGSLAAAVVDQVADRARDEVLDVDVHDRAHALDLIVQRVYGGRNAVVHTRSVSTRTWTGYAVKSSDNARFLARIELYSSIRSRVDRGVVLTRPDDFARGSPRARAPPSAPPSATGSTSQLPPSVRGARGLLVRQR